MTFYEIILLRTFYFFNCPLGMGTYQWVFILCGNFEAGQCLFILGIAQGNGNIPPEISTAAHYKTKHLCTISLLILVFTYIHQGNKFRIYHVVRHFIFFIDLKIPVVGAHLEADAASPDF